MSDEIVYAKLNDIKMQSKMSMGNIDDIFKLLTSFDAKALELKALESSLNKKASALDEKNKNLTSYMSDLEKQRLAVVKNASDQNRTQALKQYILSYFKSE